MRLFRLYVVRRLRRGSQPGEGRDGSLFKDSSGFVSHGVAQVAKNAVVSIRTLGTRTPTNTAAAMAADWVKANSKVRFTLRDKRRRTSVLRRRFVRYVRARGVAGLLVGASAAEGPVCEVCRV